MAKQKNQIEENAAPIEGAEAFLGAEADTTALTSQQEPATAPAPAPSPEKGKRNRWQKNRIATRLMYSNHSR